MELAPGETGEKTVTEAFTKIVVTFDPLKGVTRKIANEI